MVLRQGLWSYSCVRLDPAGEVLGTWPWLQCMKQVLEVRLGEHGFVTSR